MLVQGSRHPLKQFGQTGPPSSQNASAHRRRLHTHTRMSDFKTSGKLSPNGSAWTSSSKVMTMCVTKKNVKPHRAYTGSMPSAFCLPPVQNRHSIRCEGGCTDRAERMAFFLLILSILDMGRRLRHAHASLVALIFLRPNHPQERLLRQTSSC